MDVLPRAIIHVDLLDIVPMVALAPAWVSARTWWGTS